MHVAKEGTYQIKKITERRKQNQTKKKIKSPLIMKINNDA